MSSSTGDNPNETTGIAPQAQTEQVPGQLELAFPHSADPERLAEVIIDLIDTADNASAIALGAIVSKLDPLDRTADGWKFSRDERDLIIGIQTAWVDAGFSE